MIPTTTIEELIQGFYDGKYSIFNLPSIIYYFTVEDLDKMVFSGFGYPTHGNAMEFEKVVNYRANIGRFSGAKTFQQSRELTAFVFNEDGTKRAFAEFRAKALEINDKYNVKWLKTEQDSVFTQSQNARKWLKFESESEIFPVLKYVTVGDERVRPSHAKLDGLKARVNDPIWNSIMPQNDWGCRCTVIQLEETRLTTKAEKESKTALLMDDFKKDDTFNYNPGKSEYIFKETGKGKHPYFKVPRQFNDDLKKNFNFPSVGEVTGRWL